MVGFLLLAGSTLRCPFCNCRARFAATMMNLYVLPSGSSGIAYCAFGLGLSATFFSLLLDFFAVLETLQDRSDFFFHAKASHALGPNNGGQCSHRLFYLVIHKDVVVLVVI